jgi:hypothetical protein
VKARVLKHPSPLGGRAATRSPKVRVPAVGLAVQPLREERRGWPVWAVFGLRSGGGLLRGLLIRARPVSRLRCAPAAGDASEGQPPLVDVFRRPRIGASSAGEVSRPKAARNGPDLDARTSLADARPRLELRGGADATRGGF